MFEVLLRSILSVLLIRWVVLLRFHIIGNAHELFMLIHWGGTCSLEIAQQALTRRLLVVAFRFCLCFSGWQSCCFLSVHFTKRISEPRDGISLHDQLVQRFFLPCILGSYASIVGFTALLRLLQPQELSHGFRFVLCLVLDRLQLISHFVSGVVCNLRLDSEWSLILNYNYLDHKISSS